MYDQYYKVWQFIAIGNGDFHSTINGDVDYIIHIYHDILLDGIMINGDDHGMIFHIFVYQYRINGDVDYLNSG